MKTLPWLISMAIHGLVLLMGGLGLQQAVVGIAPGRNSVEVNLVAAPSESTPVSVAPPPDKPVEPPAQPPTPVVTETTEPPVPVDPLPSPDAVPAPPPATAVVSPAASSPEPVKPAHLTTKAAKKQNNAAASNSGKDTVTAQSVAGAIIDEQPDYLSNPAPIYPQAARDQEQEGRVVLDVIVDTNGCSEMVKVASGSGYFLLDNAAREAVQHYRFRPAMLNGVKVRSHVRVPIRFRLDG